MIKSELVVALAEENEDLTVEDARLVIDLFFKAIEERLAEGGRVELRGFGSFSTRGSDERVGRNPRTGERVTVDAKRKVHFKPGKEMRERLQRAAAGPDDSPDARHGETATPPGQRTD